MQPQESGPWKALTAEEDEVGGRGRGFAGSLAVHVFVGVVVRASLLGCASQPSLSAPQTFVSLFTCRLNPRIHFAWSYRMPYPRAFFAAKEKTQVRCHAEDPPLCRRHPGKIVLSKDGCTIKSQRLRGSFSWSRDLQT